MVDDVHVDRHPLVLGEQVGHADWRDGARAGGVHCVPTAAVVDNWVTMNGPGSDCRWSGDFLGEPDQEPPRSADVAEPIRVFVLDNFAADELGTVLAEPGERLVD